MRLDWVQDVSWPIHAPLCSMAASVMSACAGWAFDQEGIVRDVPASVNKVRML